MAMKARSLPVLGPQGFVNLAYWDWEGPAGAPTVICVHGLIRNGRDFDPLAEALSTRFRVVCPDLPGRGRSDWLGDAHDYSFPLYMAALGALYARLDVSTINWIGTSLGGQIGMLFAALPQSPVRRLVLNDAGPIVPREGLARIAGHLAEEPGFSNRSEMEAYLRKVHLGFGTLSEAHWRHVVAHSARTRNDGKLGLAYDPKIGEPFRAESQQADAKDIDFTSFYDRITCPTLLLRGGDSDLLRRTDAIGMTRRGPRAEIVEFPGVGHAPALMAEDQIAPVRDFLLAG